MFKTFSIVLFSFLMFAWLTGRTDESSDYPGEFSEPDSCIKFLADAVSSENHLDSLNKDRFTAALGYELAKKLEDQAEELDPVAAVLGVINSISDRYNKLKFSNL